jgi:hypothetical protein
MIAPSADRKDRGSREKRGDDRPGILNQAVRRRQQYAEDRFLVIGKAAVRPSEVIALG